MRKEGLYYYDGNNIKLVGYEILADFPYLLSNPEIDFKTFAQHLELLKQEKKDYIYHLNIGTKTLNLYFDEVVKQIKHHPLKENIVIEILEENNPNVNQIIENLAKEKIKISIDDFGTESSNIDRVIKNIDYIESIKIDRVLWTHFPELVKGLVSSLAQKGKDIKVLAEKVETEEEFKKLYSYGVRYFQGWYFKGLTIHNKEIDEISIINDQELLSYLFSKSLKISNPRSLDDVINVFKAVVIAYSYNIPLDNSEEFNKILEKVYDKEKIDLSKVIDNASQRTIKDFGSIMAGVKLLEKKLDEVVEKLKEIDFKKSTELSDTTSEIISIVKGIEKHIVDVKLTLSEFSHFNPEDYLSKREFFMEIRYRFNKKVPTTILYIHFPSLKNVFYEQGAFYYTDFRNYIIQKLNSYIPADTLKTLVDPFTIAVVLDKDIKSNEKYIKKLKEQLSKLSYPLNKRFIDLQPKLAYTDFKESDDDSNKPIARIESLLYELVNFESDEVKE